MSNTQTLTQFVQENNQRDIDGTPIEIMEVGIDMELSDVDNPVMICHIDALCDDNPIESAYIKSLSIGSNATVVFPENNAFLDAIFNCVNTEYQGLNINENIQSRFEALLNGENASDFDVLEASLTDIAFGLPRTGFVPDDSPITPMLEQAVFSIESTGEVFCNIKIRVGTDHADDVKFYMDIPNDIETLVDPLPADTQLEIIKNIFYGSLESIRNYRPFKNILY